MKKIIVLGNAGAGKSTFTASLGKQLNIDYLHLDTVVFKYNWTEHELNIIERKIQNFTQKDSWIIDGNFLDKGTWRFEECDTIFFLDINRLTCLLSIIKRFFKYRGKIRDSRSEECDEKLTFSFLKWTFSTFYKTSRKRILKLCKESKKNVIIFKNRNQINQYLRGNHL